MPPIPIPSVGIMWLITGLLQHLKKCIKKEKEKKGTDPAYTVLIPFRNNEIETLLSVINSLAHQTVKPSKVIILDDCSDKKIPEIRQRIKNVDAFDVETFRFDKHRGKAANVNYALQRAGIDTPYVMVLDADTRLEPRYIGTLFKEAGNFDVAYGTVLPDFNFPSLYAYSRVVEYIYGHAVTKQGFAFVNSLNITGCLPLYRTETLREVGGYPIRTFTEDLDLAWVMLEKGRKIVYVDQTTGYTREPSSFKEFNEQIHRWFGGFWQTLKVHGGEVGESNWLTLMISIILFDLIFAPFWIAFLAGSLLLFLSHFQLFNILAQPFTSNIFVHHLAVAWQRWFPFAYSWHLAAISIVVDVLPFAIVTFLKARKLKCLKRALLGFPIFYLLNWYAKFVWIKCLIKWALCKPPKVTPVW